MALPFPAGCPPVDSAPKPGNYFRLGRKGLAVGESTTPESWLRPYETRSGKYYKQSADPEAHGLSVFADVEELRSAAAFSPWLAGKPVAEITIGASDGHLRNTPTAQGDSHHDWWTNPYDLVPVGTVIEVLEEAKP